MGAPLVRRELSRFRGEERDTAGDGFFATFDGPARAIRAGQAIVDAVRRLGLELRVGIHVGECEVHDNPIDLADVAAILDGNPRATWLKAVGPERAELIGNVMGSRKRLALALDTDEAGLLSEIMKRLGKPHKPIKVSAGEAN